jgi:hypothetical protein
LVSVLPAFPPEPVSFHVVATMFVNAFWMSCAVWAGPVPAVASTLIVASWIGSR